MSTPLPTIDLSTINGTYTLPIPAAYTINNTAWIDLLNQSPYNLPFQAGDLQITVPAWDHYPIQIAVKSDYGNYWQPTSAVQFPPKITPALLGSPGASLSTLLIVTLYGLGETPASTQPRSLNYQNYVPNTITTVGAGTVVSSLVNDGNLAGTSIVEATVSGDASSAITLTNDANMVLGNANHSGSLTVVGNATLADTIKFLNQNATAIQQLNSADFIFESGVEVGRIANNGDITAGAGLGNFIGNGLKLKYGQRLIGLSWFGPYLSVTSPANFNHNLGAIPTIVLTQSTGGVTTTRTTNINYATMTSTQFSADSNVAGFEFYGIALLFG